MTLRYLRFLIREINHFIKIQREDLNKGNEKLENSVYLLGGLIDCFGLIQKIIDLDINPYYFSRDIEMEKFMTEKNENSIVLYYYTLRKRIFNENI